MEVTQVSEQIAREATLPAIPNQTTTALAQASDLGIPLDKFPWLQIAHGVGGLQGKFDPGSLVIDKEYLLVPKETVVEASILHCQEFIREVIPQTERNVKYPRRFETLAEAQAAMPGKRMTFGPMGEKPDITWAFILHLMIKLPDAVMCPMYTVELDGGRYVFVKMMTENKAYRNIADPINKARHWGLKNKLHMGIWELQTVYSINKKNPSMGAWVPKVHLKAIHSAGFEASLLALFKGSIAVPSPDVAGPEEEGVAQPELKL